MVALEIGRVFVACPREATRLLVLLAKPDARIEDGHDRGVDAGLVHVRQRHLDRPSGRVGAFVAGQGRGMDRRDDVMVNIDSARLYDRRRDGPRHGRCLRQGGRRRDPPNARGGDASEEIPPAHGRPGESRGGAHNNHTARRNRAVWPA